MEAPEADSKDIVAPLDDPAPTVLAVHRADPTIIVSPVGDRWHHDGTMATRSTGIPGWVPYFNVVARPLIALGVPPGPDVLLTVRGRRSGEPRSTPVTLCEHGGRRGFISPFGETQWVRNLRAAGRATISVGRRTEEVTVSELAPAEAAGFIRDVIGAGGEELVVGRMVRAECRQARHRPSRGDGLRQAGLRDHTGSLVPQPVNSCRFLSSTWRTMPQ
jgi:deazaflavin-dependent oxidoreductase (nitroreductase family)